MIEKLNNISYDQLVQAQARQSHLEFMRFCWQKRIKFQIGIHTNVICKKIDQAFLNYRNGISTYLMVLVCFRQGKSEIVSKYLPPHFLGEFPDDEIIVTSHSQRILAKFSRFGRAVLRSKQYQKLYPGIEISKEKSGVEEWGIEGRQGISQYIGIGAGSAGSGGGLIIIDDYFGKREDAESEVIREKIWESFSDNIFTRQADPCIFLITVTPWHTDDIVGRIQQQMKDDPQYPKFEIIKFPGISNQYKSGYLFTEKYSPTWYEIERKVLGQYGFASLMQCDPQIRSGNMLKTDKVQYYTEETKPENIQWVRAWDLASTSKQQIKQDPDYTVGIKLGIKEIQSQIPGVSIPIIYVDDVIRGQWEATQRDRIIRSTAIADGYIQVGVEAYAGYKDAYVNARDALYGLRTVKKLQLPGDKMAKADPLVAPFEAGNVWIRRASWNDDFLKVIQEFPSGKHDDDVDAMACAYHMVSNTGMPIYTATDYQQYNDKKHEVVEFALARIRQMQTVGCNLEEYMQYVRPALLEELEKMPDTQKKQFLKNEINRLDRILGYEKLIK